MSDLNYPQNNIIIKGNGRLIPSPFRWNRFGLSNEFYRCDASDGKERVRHEVLF